MSKLKKFSISVAVIALSLIALAWVLLRSAEVPNERGDFPPYVKTYSYVGGALRIDDTQENITIFKYHVDAPVRPVRVEKNGDGQWVVTLERRK